MTQMELKREIEDTREILDTAIEEKSGSAEILNISMVLDGLIEEYLSLSPQNCKLGQ